MTPEAFAEQLKETLGDTLRAVILFGSAAGGDHMGRRSDYNVLLVAQRLGINQLRAMTGPVEVWTQRGNPPPLLFTEKRLRQSCDTFPIELLDMKQSHRVLLGEDVLLGLEVSRANLRHQVEFELKGKLIKLREDYLLTRGRARAVLGLLVASLSPLLAVFRAALRLYEGQAPADKLEALALLARHIPFDPKPFDNVARLKAGTADGETIQPEALFEQCLAQLEVVVDAIDALEG